MRQLLRTAVATARPAPAEPALHIHDVGRLHRRVRLADLDVLLHMNNGSYLATMDLGRYDLLRRSGIMTIFRQHGWYPVIANQMISYRRPLAWRRRYVLETKVAGYDERTIYLEQRFVADGDVCAVAFVCTRLRKRTGGPVTREEITEATGVDLESHRPPDWLVAWAQSSTLPPARDHFPSDWT